MVLEKNYVHTIIVNACVIKKKSPELELSISCREILYIPVHNEAKLYS